MKENNNTKVESKRKMSITPRKLISEPTAINNVTGGFNFPSQPLKK